MAKCLDWPNYYMAQVSHGQIIYWPVSGGQSTYCQIKLWLIQIHTVVTSNQFCSSKSLRVFFGFAIIIQWIIWLPQCLNDLLLFTQLFVSIQLPAVLYTSIQRVEIKWFRIYWVKKYTHVTSNKSLTPCVKSFIRGKALGTRFARARALHPL